MDNSSYLRALDNLFSEDTLIAFVVGLAFLTLQNWLRRKVQKWIPNNWLAVYLGALLSYIALVIPYWVVNVVAHYVYELRFGPQSFGSIRGGFLMTFLAGLVIPVLYVSCYFLQESLLKRIKGNTSRMMVMAIVVLSILYLPMISLQAISNGTVDYRLLNSIAIWVPGPFGTTMAVLVYNYYTYLNGFKLQENKLQIAMLRQQVTQSQLDTLSSKINPHFLYNSLNSIAALATIDGGKTRGMAIALSKLFKYSLNNEEKSYASVQEEIDMVELYLHVEKIRFEEKLKYKSSVQEGISDCLIPRNLLQPLVENAIKHGSGIDGVEIEINIEKSKNGTIIIRVRDSGGAFVALNPGYGLKSVYDKLDILVPGNYEIAFFNEPKMVQIELFDTKFREL